MEPDTTPDKGASIVRASADVIAPPAPRRSADYTVFIDESFYQWFGLPTKESNLCYGALSVPTDRLKDLERFEVAARQFAHSHLPDAQKNKRNVAELKYADFRYLTPAIVDCLGRKFEYFLRKNRAFIFGFFVPAEGFMNYKLRSDYFDSPNALISMTEAERHISIEKIRQEILREGAAAEHGFGFLSESYRQFFDFIVQFHGKSIKKTFSIIYDSRHPEEDVQLHRDAEEFARKFTPKPFERYQGYTSAESSDSPGLRLADWTAGEVRNFFYRNPTILGDDSQFSILSPFWNPNMVLLEGRAPFYRRELSPQAKACFQKTGEGFMLPQIKEHFAVGLLSYYAQQGEARHISIPQLVALDMAD